MKKVTIEELKKYGHDVNSIPEEELIRRMRRVNRIRRTFTGSTLRSQRLQQVYKAFMNMTNEQLDELERLYKDMDELERLYKDTDVEDKIETESIGKKLWNFECFCNENVGYFLFSSIEDALKTFKLPRK